MVTVAGGGSFTTGKAIVSVALRALQHQEVLLLSGPQHTGLSDVVGPAFVTNTFLEKRVLLQALETLPLAYIREGTIIEDELRAALAAYRTGQEPSADRAALFGDVD